MGSVERRGPMPVEVLPEWIAGLEDEDVAFIKKFILSSGSLKEMAGHVATTFKASRL